MHKILQWGYSNDTKVTEVEWLWNLSDLSLSSWGSCPWQPGETPGPQSSLTALMLVLVHYPDNTFIQQTVSFIYRETGWWIKGHRIKLRGTTSQGQGCSERNEKAVFSVDIPLNPLSPKSDQHEISPRDINVLENSGLENWCHDQGRWV